MTTDLRGFSYSLEPLRQSVQCRLESLHVKLGNVQNDVRRHEHALETMRQQHRSKSAEIEQALNRLLGTGHYQAGLRWLADMQSEMHNAEVELNALHAQRRQVANDCMEQQIKVDTIEAHRTECLESFIAEETARTASEMDRDWLMRGENPMRRIMQHETSAGEGA